MPKLTIVRGLPGSGKSTYAQTIVSLSTVHVEADMFFTEFDGEYKFNADLLGAAHDWCYGAAAMCLNDGLNCVVSNTFTKMWEMEKYLALATKIPDLQIDVVEMRTRYGSIHNVPAEKVEQMKNRWEEYEFEKKVIS